MTPDQYAMKLEYYQRNDRLVKETRYAIAAVTKELAATRSLWAHWKDADSHQLPESVRAAYHRNIERKEKKLWRLRSRLKRLEEAK